MRVVGLDLSLNSTGIADETGAFVISSLNLRGAARLKHVAGAIDRICRLGVKADVVVMEGYSHDSKFQGPQLGELGGVVKVCLYQRGITYVSVPPKRLKKYATDNGNAGKDLMLAAAVREHPEINNNNAADAYWLRHMGLAHYEQRDFIQPEYRRTVLQSIEWPELPEEAIAV